MQLSGQFSHSKSTPAARAHASPLDCHWTARLLDPEANACEMEPSNRTNDRHSGSRNLLPSPGGIPAAGGTRFVMEGSFGLCLDHARPCRQHGSFISGPSRPSPSLNHPPRHALAHRCLWSGVGRASWAHRTCTRCSHALMLSTWCCSARPSRTEDRPLKGIKGCSSLVEKLLPPSSFSITPNKLTSQVLSPHTTS